MKQEEFEHRVQELGYQIVLSRTNNFGPFTILCVMQKGTKLAEVSLIFQYKMNTMTPVFNKEHEKLFELLSDFARTPMGERK